MKRRRAWIGIAAVSTVSLLVASCGESDREKVSDAIADDLQADAAFAGVIDDEEAACVGESIVDDLGTEAASNLGRPTPASDDFDLGALSEQETDAIGVAMETCVDDIGALVADVVADGTLDAPDGGLTITEAEAACVGDAVAEQMTFGRLLQIRVDARATASDELDQLTGEEAAVYARAYTSCIDVRAAILEGVREGGADPEVVACLDQQISDQDIEDRFVALFSGDEDAAADAFAGAIDACT